MLLRLLLVSVLIGDTYYGVRPPPKYTSADGKWSVTIHAASGKGGKVAVARLRRGFRRARRWSLPISPGGGLVANDGTVVVLGHGYGDTDAVLIYRADGTLVARHRLSDLVMDGDRVQLLTGHAPVPWSGQRIDDQRRQVILELTRDKEHVENVILSLEDGQLTAPKRFLFPQPAVVLDGSGKPEDGRCGNMDVLTGDALLAEGVAVAVPAYPPVARKARIAGTVVLELVVNEEGRVESVRIVKPLPFGLDQASHDAAKQWRFHPRTAKACARVAVQFSWP